MKYFETVKAALDANYVVICNHKGVELEKGPGLLKQALKGMTAEWFKYLPANIDYGDPFVRFAYLYAHTAANANLCEIAIRQSPEVVSLITERAEQKGKLRVCAFGGGPGTELLALSKHLLKTRPDGPHLQVKFNILDRIDEWVETWKALAEEIDNVLDTKYGPFPKHPFSMSGMFHSKDMTDRHQYVNLPSLFDQDIFFLNYVVSEITGNRTEGITQCAPSFVELIAHAAKACPKGSVFVIADRDQDHIVAGAEGLLKAAGLSTTGVIKVCDRMDRDEKPDVLKGYAAGIEWKPRSWWKGPMGSNSNRGAFYIVGTKE